MRFLQSRFGGVRWNTQVHSIVLLLIAVLVAGGCQSVRPPDSPGGIPVTAATRAAPTNAPTAVGTGCTTSSPSSGGYKVTVCFSAPPSGTSLTGNATVTATATATGSAVQRIVFSLDGDYLLTDYASPYSFSLPTAKWVDGSHTLSVSALMRDGFTTAQASRSVTFKNGVTGVPKNTNVFHPTSGRPSVTGTPFVVAATGDGASGQPTSASVVSLLKKVNPNLLLYLGDTYERGSAAEFFNWYAGSSNFGALRSITDPTVGNHEYLVPGASGYFDYWDNVPGYYSFNADGWHFISLNSNASFEPTGAGSAQYNWLNGDLAALPPNTCTIVFYHHPYFNVGPEGASTQLAAIWQLMAQYHVAIVLNGHDHDYQRWVPLDGSGAVNPQGITEFVVGSGGHGLQTFVKSDARVANENDSNPTAFGALFLTLDSTSATFKYENTSGTVLDSGTVPCPSGTSMLRADGSPTQRGDPGFSAYSLNARNTSNSGTSSNIVSDDTWGKTSTTYNNMPTPGGHIAPVSTASGGRWTTFDVSPYLQAASTGSLAITTTGFTSVSLATRESGST